ncbi:MAG: RNA polymerase sigma factor [Candidatus Sumerlaeia bacterium]
MNPDKNAIEAVKAGDRNRFAELVERHERMVYGIAWSYLGDAELCHDAAQETFIKAFRYIGALRDAERFPAWLSRIARNVSATLLRRRRTDLANRRRWQAEQPEPVVTPRENPDENLKEMLGRTLAELPPQHRECLVLFYLENKSIHEVAAILGLSESAVKTRLHRARGALRGRLEEQIERDLKGLAPRKGFTASVMLVLPAKPLGVIGLGGGASFIGKATSWLSSLVPMLLLALWAALCQAGFSYLLVGWFNRMESSNLIDKPDNRFRLAVLRRNTIVMAMCMGLVAATIVLVPGVLGPRAFWQLLAVYGAWGVYKSMLVLRVNRSPFTKAVLLAQFVYMTISGLIGFFGFNPAIVFVAMFFLNIVLVRVNRYMPRRQDYNLFLREAKGMLGDPGEMLDPARPATEPELHMFARFLGDQWLVREYSSSGRDFVMRLAPVHQTLKNMFNSSITGDSTLVIRGGRDCDARLNASEAKAIESLTGRSFDASGLERSVSQVAAAALGHFIAGRRDEAKALLSTTSDEEIFAAEYANAKGYRRQHMAVIATSVILLAMGVWMYWGAYHR